MNNDWTYQSMKYNNKKMYHGSEESSIQWGMINKENGGTNQATDKSN